MPKACSYSHRNGNITWQPIKLNCGPLDDNKLEVLSSAFSCYSIYFFQKGERERAREIERGKVFALQMQYFVLILKTVPQSLGGKKKSILHLSCCQKQESNGFVTAWLREFCVCLDLCVRAYFVCRASSGRKLPVVLVRDTRK